MQTFHTDFNSSWLEVHRAVLVLCSCVRLKVLAIKTIVTSTYCTFAYKWRQCLNLWYYSTLCTALKLLVRGDGIPIHRIDYSFAEAG